MNDEQHANAPPHNTQAERSVLGSVLLENTAILRVVGSLEAHHFYWDAHKVLFDVMLRMSQEPTAIDPVTLEERLSTEGVLDKIGGDTILEIRDATPNAANVEYYADIVRKEAARRHAIISGHETIARATDPGEDIDDVLDGMENAAVAARTASVTKPKTINEIMSAKFDESVNPEHDILDRGLKTGIGSIDDRMTMQPGAMWIVIAATGVGKTTLAANIARNVSLSGDAHTVFFSLEMPEYEVVRKLVAIHSRIEVRGPKGGRQRDEWVDAWNKAVVKISKAGDRLAISDHRGLEISKICAAITRMALEGRCRLVVIDYLHLITLPEKMAKEMRRDEQLDYIARRIRDTCGPLGVSALVLAQPKTLGDEHKAPTIEDLKDSRGPAQHSDVILSLWDDGSQRRLKFLKNRNGAIGECPIDMDVDTGVIVEGRPGRKRGGDVDPNELGRQTDIDW